MSEQQLYDEILKQKEQLQNLLQEHWELYSSMDTWFFWFNLATIIIPLIILYFLIDRRRLFEICFYGYTAHILWLNTDIVLSNNNYLTHPHSISHILPQGFTITAVLFPVVFMLLYQYCTNNEKNFYLYAIIVSIIFACGAGGISGFVDLLRMHKGMNFFYLTLIDIVIAFIALWATKLFQRIKHRTKQTSFNRKADEK
ncbi:hypothetical protein [Lentibacillus sp. CBA3610]|uniref:hypothetical protein n=1 Tax=Lentibacillus sp. CBA3610 TaxID=2518176 RepID=UPI0015961E36|nr:hypothetical protein [Lentibacillus sp. CBA3610]QKY70802.1 hypothetical protein Len3610_15525 [Lentibacillus sp. CBA3610]